MKKALVLLLGMSMVLSLAVTGCKDKDNKKETRTIRESADKTKVTTTEETDDTDETDDPSETTEETTEDTTTEETSEDTTEDTTADTTTAKTPTKSLTSATSDTTSEPSDTSAPSAQVLPHKDSFKVDRSLEYVDFEVFPIFYVYGATHKNSGKDILSPDYVRCYIDAFDLGNDDSYEDLFNVLDGAINPRQNAVADQYDAAREAFIAQEKQDMSKLDSSAFNYFLYPCRNDSQIISVIGETAVGDHDDYVYESFAFYTQTGEKINYSDVVKDPKALASLISGLLHDPANETQMLSDIESGNVAFGLTYNNFIISNAYYDFLICAADHPEIFDMSFFGSAPERFNLKPDSVNETITWDFDENGTTDTVRAVYDEDHYYEIKDIELNINGTIFHAPNTDIFEGSSYEDLVVFNDGESYYLYLLYCPEDVYTYAYVYKITGNGLTFIQDEVPADFTEAFCIDPANYTVGLYNFGVVGTVYMRQYMSLIGGEGILHPLYPYLEGSATVFTTKQEIKGKKVDISTGEEIEDVTIAPDTTLSLYLLDSNYSAIYFNVCTEVEDDGYCVKFDLVQDGDYSYTIQGIDADELFYYVSHAG